jgi:PBSX family phage terminase large subunit
MEKRFRFLTEAQELAFHDMSPNLLLDGPWFSGKSQVVAMKAFELGDAFPGNCIALVRKKRSDLKATLWKWFIDKVLPPDCVIAHNDTDLYRKIKNGTEIYGVGLDSTNDVNKLASREYGFIGVEEATEITEEDFDEKLSRCLRLTTIPFLQLMLICNPGMPAHFIYKRFILNKLPSYNRIKATILPNRPPSYKERMDQLTGVMALRYREGEWVAYEGLVYPFDPQKHIVKPFDIPKDWKRVIVIDFGFDHPFVCQWWAVSPSDAWFLYREIYYSRRTVKTHSAQIKHYNEIDGIEPRIICDHDAEDQATLIENGLITQNAQKDRQSGQQAVFDKFENNQIFFFEDCTIERDTRLVMEKKPASTIEEFPSYIWTNKAKEDMTKEKDDGMDSIRYGIYTTLKSSGLIYSTSSSLSYTDLGIE